MPLPLTLIPAAVQGIKSLYTAFNKPKQVLPEETMSAINRMISNNQSDIRNKTMLNMLTSAAKSQGATQYQQSQRSLDILKNKGELSEGQYAKSLLSAGTDIQSVVGQQTQQAEIEQVKQNRSAMDLIDNARLQIAQIKDQYKQQFRQESQQWKNELAGGLLDTATSGFNAFMDNIGDKATSATVTNYLKGRNYTDLSLDDKRGLYDLIYMKYLGIDLDKK